MHDIFQEFGLICLDGYTHCVQCRDGNIKGCTTAFQELDRVLRSVCKIHGLPLAMIWVPCSACNDLPLVLECINRKATSIYTATIKFTQVAKLSHSRKKGLFERVLSSPYMLYYSDITQLSIVEHPFAHYARWCKFSGWFTICLQSSFTEKEVYVVDFFLPTNNMDDENIWTTLSLILGTMEENFKTFKLASGQRLGEILLVEVMDFWNGQKLPFAQRIQAPRLAPSPEPLKDRGLMMQLGQQVQPSTDAVHGGMNVVSQEQNYILPSLGALQDEEATMKLDSPHQPPLESSNNGHNVVPAEENITSVTSLEEGKRKTQRENKGTGVKIEVSLDDIRKCMGMKRKAAAEKLKVSESTFKRACREHDINRWPPRNMQNVSPFRPSPVEIQGQTLQLNSDQQSNQAVPGVAHMKPGVQDANRVTIRAKYKNKTIKFRLSFSSGLVEFQQEVAKRLHLEAGTYYAEYKDEEGVLIFIACDDDLQDCMHTLRSQGNTSIEILLKLEEPLISLVESTRRDPSLFEYIESESKTNVVDYAICHSKTPRRLSMLKSKVADPICHSKYINQFPEGIRNYIVEMKDVHADGNCGFRTIAALIGGDENEWKAIRAAMLEELTSNSSLYEKVSGQKGRTEELCDRLDYFGEGPAPKDKWLTMPDMGHIVASAFRVVLVFLSDKQCLTFLPFYAAPHPSSKRDVEDCVCSMGLVNNDHFVQLYMSPGSPMPPIASNWLNNRQPHAEGWSAPFCSQIKDFRRIIGSDLATRETFDLID
ncbi:hypothetical protein Vadar_015127 [Vaccinium darrowii]|uniref:Uncharacterized protein n=1 Tax=Vaccinium darrowii TaxID=229202 RepID=A0ACB7XIC1_9ERIC|nr:hypothetical protein Vadar_015127 [Vaccinium darrowii]